MAKKKAVKVCNRHNFSDEQEAAIYDAVKAAVKSVGGDGCADVELATETFFKAMDMKSSPMLTVEAVEGDILAVYGESTSGIVVGKSTAKREGWSITTARKWNKVMLWNNEAGFYAECVADLLTEDGNYISKVVFADGTSIKT